MVWPFTRDATDAASFEKSLSHLSTKIARIQTKDKQLRSSARRYKALWTLYVSFVYTICALILALVTGYEHWGPYDYGVVICGPPIIWGVRLLISAVFDWRIASNSSQLENLKKQKAERVRKFKEATRYDQTEKLLEKYGAEVRKVPEEKSEGVARHEKSRRGSKPSQPPQPRTNLPPPPTANIQRPPPLPPPPSQLQPHHQLQSHPHAQHSSSATSSPENRRLSSSSPSSRQRGDSTASFAPNAEEDYPVQHQYANQGGRQWYDRIMDLLLGDDETKPINRTAMICRHCKLVNGQAPPGVKEVGRWRCMSCKKWNGEKGEVEKILEDRDEEKHEGKKEDTPEMMEEKIPGEIDHKEEAGTKSKDVSPARSMSSKPKDAADETLHLLREKYGSGIDEEET